MAVVQAAREMTEPPPSSDGKASLAILVAADGQATKNLLKLLLTQRGHRVDLVDDGGRALKALLDRRYDIALVDFILPTMDGLRVVAEFKSSPAAVGGSPHFIGITADAAGFMAHPDNWRTFDLVIAKPIDLTNLGTVVETSNATWLGGARQRLTKARPSPRPSFWRMMALKQRPARLV